MGLSWDAQRPVTAVGAGAPAQRGLTGLREAVEGGLPGKGGQGAVVGTLLCAGRLRRAPLTAHCGCDVSVQGQSRRTAMQRLSPAQALSSALGEELQTWGGAGSFFDPYTKPSSFASQQQRKAPEAPFPIFSSRSLALSTTACTCPKYHPSHQQCGQLRKQPSFHRATGKQ